MYNSLDVKGINEPSTQIFESLEFKYKLYQHPKQNPVVDLGSKPNFLLLAALLGDSESFSVLYNSGLCLNSTSPKIRFSGAENFDHLDGYVECNLLGLAALSGDLRTFETVLAQGKPEDIFYHGETGGPTVLHYAVWGDNIDLVSRILDIAESLGEPKWFSYKLDGPSAESFPEPEEDPYAHFPPELPVPEPEEQKREWTAQRGGLTPLELAISLKKEDIALLLIDRGANVNAWDFELSMETPLSMTYKYGMPKILERLLLLGADPDEKDSFGNSLMYYAIQDNNTEVVKILLNAGANVNKPITERRVYSGKQLENMAISVALRTLDPEIISLIESAGCTSSAVEPEEFLMENNSLASSIAKREGVTDLRTHFLHGRTWSILHKAACSKNSKTLKLIDFSKFDINEQDPMDAVTPLQVAVRGLLVENVEFLLKHGADATIKDAHGASSFLFLEKAQLEQLQKYEVLVKTHREEYRQRKLTKRAYKAALSKAKKDLDEKLRVCDRIKALLEQSVACSEAQNTGNE